MDLHSNGERKTIKKIPMLPMKLWVEVGKSSFGIGHTEKNV